ncbi:MAG: 3-hydroxyacyl-CoA dehydrogenase NAD-binding domain-containing protein, partial [Myxococcales bacterium]|nr:3-hydroxyacyl-CoA dehydrogenase NAD-binding domain-containing protein [Myxococcales bacterium]
MTEPIRRVGVIGAGVMGSGIAAHLANAGIEVVLLDIVPPNLSDEEKKDPAKRDGFAAGGLAKALKARPAVFFHKSAASLVSVGNLEDDIDLLAGCQLVIEAIIENLSIKQKLFTRLESVLAEGTVVASNTSGLRISKMVEGRGDAFRKNFLVMHFFNPVRYMKLLELVAGEETDPAVVAHISRFGEDALGKGIVLGKDTPNFVGNRIGVHSMLLTIHQMLEDGLAPEDVDQITGLPMGHPKSASFRTADMVGLDTFVHVADNCYESLLEDEERDVFAAPAYLRQMVSKKILGNKTKGGFYKKTKEGISTFDPATLEYRAKAGDEEIRKVCKGISKLEDPAERLRKLVADEGKAGAFAWKLLSRSLAYASRRIGEITDDIKAVDDAMRWGYNWELGPFETWDALGFAPTLERMKKDGIAIPASIEAMARSGATSFYAEGGKVFDLVRCEYATREADPRNATLQILRRGDSPVLENGGAVAWDLGDGVLSLTFKTKANSIDGDAIAMLHEAVAKAEAEYQALVVFNEGPHFCVGANLFAVVMAASQQQWEPIREMVRGYQSAIQRMKYGRVPVVVAPYGMALGGGLELCFGGDAVQAAAETYSGLVEVGVGLIPGGAGTLNMLWRALEGIPEGTQVDTLPYVGQVFQNIAMAKVATSADEAKHFGYFRRSDGVSFDRARHLVETKGRALGMAASGYHPPAPRAYRLPGESGIATLGMLIDSMVEGGFASEHDALISRKLASVLCGGVAGASRKMTETEMLELEEEVFISLCGEPK